MEQMPVRNDIPSPLAGGRTSQWGLVVAWRTLGYDMLRGLAYEWEVSTLIVYIMLRFLMVAEDGNPTRYSEAVAIIFFQVGSDPHPTHEQKRNRAAALEDRYLSLVQRLFGDEFDPYQPMTSTQSVRMMVELVSPRDWHTRDEALDHAGCVVMMSHSEGAEARHHADWGRLTQFLGGCPYGALVADAEGARLTDEQMVAGRASRVVYRNLCVHPYTRAELNLQRQVAVLDHECAERLANADVWAALDDAEEWSEPEDSDEEE